MEHGDEGLPSLMYYHQFLSVKYLQPWLTTASLLSDAALQEHADRDIYSWIQISTQYDKSLPLFFFLGKELNLPLHKSKFRSLQADVCRKKLFLRWVDQFLLLGCTAQGVLLQPWKSAMWIHSMYMQQELEITWPTL